MRHRSDRSCSIAILIHRRKDYQAISTCARSHRILRQFNWTDWKDSTWAQSAIYIVSSTLTPHAAVHCVSLHSWSALINLIVFLAFFFFLVGKQAPAFHSFDSFPPPSDDDDQLSFSLVTSNSVSLNVEALKPQQRSAWIRGVMTVLNAGTEAEQDQTIQANEQ